jgi:hypothetical protein
MLNHSAEAWEHVLFKDVVAKVANLDICYRAVQFYLAEHPLKVNELLAAVSARVDHARVVGIARKMNNLPLIRASLVAVQEVCVAFLKALFTLFRKMSPPSMKPSTNCTLKKKTTNRLDPLLTTMMHLTTSTWLKN